MNDKKTLSKWIDNYDIGKGGALLILLVVTLLPFLILSFYNHPSPGDDYFETDIALQKGFWEAQKWWYFNNSGRWFASMAISLNPLVFHTYWAYKLNAAILLALLLIAGYWLSGKLFSKLNISARIGICSLFIFAYLIRLPIVGDGIFWLSGANSYLTAEIMSLFLHGCIISYTNSGNKKRYLILSCLLLIAIISSYEINMIFIDLAILLIAFMSVLKKRNLFFPLSLLAICVIFSVIEITAPGNGKRATNFFPHGHQLLFSIKESIISSKNFLLHWLPFMLLIGLLLFDLLSKKNIWNHDTDIIFSIPPWLSFIACLLIPVIGMFLLFWAEGEFPPLRSVNVIFFYFITAMLYFFFSLISYIKKQFPGFTLPAYIKLPVYFMLVFVLAFRTNNISVAYRDITSGIASEYNKEQTERFEFLTNFKGDSCTIDSIRQVPYSFSFFELPQDFRCKKPEGDENNITTDAQYFYRMRTSFYRYYHKRYIGIKGRKS